MSENLSVSIKKLSKNYQSRQIISDLDLSIEKASFVSIVGPSGCGKSTLLKLIAGLENKSSGDLKLQDLSVGFVFQEANLLDWRTVEENVLLPLEIQKSNSSQEEMKEKVQRALKQVQLSESASLFPHQLSGGMKMRVSLARALVNEPRLLLLDEPFAALDETTRFEMQNLLLNLWQQQKMTVIFVTHSLFEAAYLSQRIILLKGAGAKIAMDEKISFPFPRTEDLRTSSELNNYVRHFSEGLKK